MAYDMRPVDVQAAEDPDAIDDPDAITIQVSDVKGAGFKVKINPGKSLYELRLAIEKIKGVPPEKQRLVFAGQELKEDDISMEEAGFKDDAVLFLIAASSARPSPAGTPVPHMGGGVGVGDEEDPKSPHSGAKRLHPSTSNPTPKQRQQMVKEREQEAKARAAGAGQRRGPPSSSPPSKPKYDDAQARSLVKWAQGHCRAIIVLAEICLVLLVVWWGQAWSMVRMFLIMLVSGFGFYGTRRFDIRCIFIFLVYLIMEIFYLLLLFGFGAANGHESVYGSTAAYLFLLMFEAALYCVWLVYYWKFIKKIRDANPYTVAYAANLARNTAVCI